MNRQAVIAELKALILKLETADGSPAPAPRTTFVGFPLLSKYAGRCHVCNGNYEPGDPVLYDKQLKKTAHPQCGTKGA